MTTFWNNVTPIIDGEAVKASTPNRPIQQLTSRTQYLYDALLASSAGTSLFKRGVTLGPTVEVGDIVYYDATPTGGDPVGYYKAIAEVASGQLNEEWFAGKRSYAEGIVVSLNTGAPNTGDILVLGSLNIADVLSLVAKSLSDLFEDSIVGNGGQVYLSSTVPGKLSQKISVVSAFIGSLDLGGNIFINPSISGSNRDHIHLMFELAATPAGLTEPPLDVEDPHVINNPDVNARGWLPATVTYFPTQTIPAGAVFGYNLDHPSDATLKSNFPPVPLDYYYIERDGIGLDTWMVQVNADGIWWLSDTYAQAPWPADYNNTPPEIPDLKCVDIKFWITKLNLTNGSTNVITINSDTSDDSRIPVEVFSGAGLDETSPQVNGRSGLLNVATARLTSTNEDSTDGRAISDIVGSVKKKTPITMSLTASPGITLVGDYGNAVDGFYGNVNVGITGLVSFTDQAELTILNGVREDSNNGIHFLAMPPNKQTSLRYKGKLAYNFGATKFRLKVTYFAKLTGTIPSLAVNYRVIPEDLSGAQVAVPVADSSLAGGLPSVAVTAQNTITVFSDYVTAAAGSVIFFELVRSAAAGYNSDVGILSVSYIFE